MENVSIMELRHLRYFVAVAEAMNFRRAAEALNMTQPPLSQQIQRLEIELGLELFHRQGRSITLSVAGEVFLTEAYRILDRVDGSVKRVQQVARGEIGHLHIGFVESAAYRLLPAIIRAFRIKYPKVELTLSSMTSNEQLNALIEARIDVGFCRVVDDEVDKALHIEAVLTETFCAVLPRCHPLAQQDTLQLHQLADESFILFPRQFGTALFRHIIRACQEAGFTPNITQEAVQMTTIVGLVAAGLGVSLLPASVMALPHAEVSYMKLPAAGSSQLAMVWHEDTVASVVQQFIRVGREAAPNQDSFDETLC